MPRWERQGNRSSFLPAEKLFNPCYRFETRIRGSGFERARLSSCGNLQSGDMRGFQPPHIANRVNEGLSPGRAFHVILIGNPEFLRSQFRCQKMRA